MNPDPLVPRPPGEPTPPPLAGLRPLLLPLVLIALAIVALTVGGILQSVRHHQAEQSARLDAIVDLKTRQIADWVRERQGDARSIQASRSLVENYHRWQTGGDLPSRELLAERLEQFPKNYGFDSILLLDEGGRPRWDSAGDPRVIAPVLEDAARQAATDHQARLVGPYRDPAGRVWLDFLAPLRAPNGQPTPVAVLHTNPADYLYPTLQTWPVPSASGETLLFRGEGQEILYLNELRHQADTALKLRMPLTARRLLAAQVLRGEVAPGQVVEGVDYRGVPAFGVGRTVPGTDWWLMAKLDGAEVYAEAAAAAGGIALVGLLALVAAGAGTLLLRQRQQLAAAQHEQLIQADKLRALRLLDAIANGSTDAIYAKDAAGHYLLFNRAAAQMVGKGVDEALGRDDTALFPPVQAARIMAEDRQLLANDCLVKQEEDRHLADGEHTFLTTRGPLRDADGTLIGLFGIAHDISERKQAEREIQALNMGLEQRVAQRTAALEAEIAERRRMETDLQAQNAELERFNRAMIDRELDMISLKGQINDLATRLGLAPPYPLDFLNAPPPPSTDDPVTLEAPHDA